MPTFTGLLTISSGVARLDGVRLAMEPLTGDPFGRAASFLRQDRNLRSNQRIFVDGVARTIEDTPAIVITNAGPAMPAIVLAGGALTAAAATLGAKKGARSDGKTAASSRKSGTKKGAAKKSGSAKKAPAKKSAAKKK